MTDLGPLDVLGAIEHGLAFDDLLPDSIEIQLDSVAIHVLNLATIVKHKRASAHPKDQQALPVLEEALRQLNDDG